MSARLESHTPNNTRARLLEAAAARVHDQGFFRTSLDEIAKDVQIAKATFYHHFKNKDELGRALIDFNVERYEYALKEQIFNPRYRGVEQLVRWRDFVIEKFKEGDLQKGCPICNLVNELSRQSDDFRQRLQHFFNSYEAMIVQAFEKAHQEGDIQSDGDFAKIAKLVLAQCFGVIVLARTTGSREEAMASVSSSFSALYSLLGIANH